MPSPPSGKYIPTVILSYQYLIYKSTLQQPPFLQYVLIVVIQQILSSMMEILLSNSVSYGRVLTPVSILPLKP